MTPAIALWRFGSPPGLQTSKVEASLGVWGFIPSHFLSLPDFLLACNLTSPCFDRKPKARVATVILVLIMLLIATPTYYRWNWFFFLLILILLPLFLANCSILFLELILFMSFILILLLPLLLKYWNLWINILDKCFLFGMVITNYKLTCHILIIYTMMNLLGTSSGILLS